MSRINQNYLKLHGAYLFPEIQKRVNAFKQNNPEQADKVISCGIGDVTEPLPTASRKAMKLAVDEMGNSATFRGYGPTEGYEFLRDKIAKHNYQKFNADIRADEIFVSDGAKCDSANILDIFENGIKVAVMNPVYPVYVDTNVMTGNAGEPTDDGKYSELIYLDCTSENGFVPRVPKDAGKVELIYLCYPNNPTGSCASVEVLTEWVNFALEQGAIILYDAAYSAFIQDEALPKTIYQIPGARKCAIEFGSFSKNGGFTGTRCAWCVVPEEVNGVSATGEKLPLHKLWMRRQSTKFNGVSYIIQKAAEALYSEEGSEQVAKLINHYMTNAQALKTTLETIGLATFGGDNAPYIWVECPKKASSWEFFDTLLTEANIICTPGSGFGSAGEGYFRLSAFNSKSNIKEVCDRLKALKL